MSSTESSNPISRCIAWADSENYATSENTRKIISVSLVLVQLVGLLLLVSSLPGSTQLVAMPETLTLSLALGGGVLLLGGSFFWAILGYHQKHPAAKRGLYVLTAIAIFTIAIGIIGYNGLFSGMGISAARCVMGAGFIMAMPLIFPCFFSLLKCCLSKLENSLKESTITPFPTRSSEHSPVVPKSKPTRKIEEID